MTLGIIGGTGALELFEKLDSQQMTTPFGPPSARPRRIMAGGQPAWFMARHGDPHRIPPHRVNYRANIWTLRQLGVSRLIAINAVGGVNPELAAGELVVPDQIIDYTWGRDHSFSDGGAAPLRHVEFAWPFAGQVRAALLEAAAALNTPVRDGGVYGATQGPRLETAAEVRRLQRDGCDLVGMTGMPEAGLAREQELDYAMLCVVSNPAAGVLEQPIDEAEIHAVLARAMHVVAAVVDAAAGRL